VDFFDKSVTHVISDAELPPRYNLAGNIFEKENNHCDKPASKRGVVASIKFSNRYCDVLLEVCWMYAKLLTYSAKEDKKKNVAIQQQALASGMKIWNAAKLDSVLSRCLHASNFKQAPPTERLPLSKLLQAEKIHGTTERDPTQRRHNYLYFTPGSCFVLLEDINQELATIAAHEYPIVKDKDSNRRKPWPVLHCHPHSRNPFAPFDEKERRRWERQQQAEKEEEEERTQRQRRRQLEAIRRRAASRKGDLRRSVSLNNIQRQFQMNDCVDLEADGDDIESANASGYLASGAGYLAASGNSVGITSTTGTTSMSAQVLRKLRLPTSMNERIKHQVVTNLKVSAKEKDDNTKEARLMGPPALPRKHQALLKRSKSTNTMKLPKREEGVKPGYCESCRIKFSDFAEVCSVFRVVCAKD
jgi:regulatory subunit for Cdc7p protein kinase